MPLRWLTNCGKDEVASIIALLADDRPGRKLTTGEPIPMLTPDAATLSDLKAWNYVGVYEVERDEVVGLIAGRAS